MIQNLGKFAHPRNPNKGRHSAGANPAPGSTFRPRNAASQPEPAGNKVTTGSKTFGAPRNPMTNPTNQAAQAQSQISANPAPFKSPNGVLGMGAPAVMPNGPTSKHTAGLSGSKAPAHPPKQYSIKTKGHMVGVNFPGKKHKSPMTASATKGGHSLLYGD